jgi:hypothetical protein
MPHNCSAAGAPCRQAAEEGAADFQFARRADGSVKEIKGALGGLRMVAGDQNKKALERTINTRVPERRASAPLPVPSRCGWAEGNV